MCAISFLCLYNDACSDQISLRGRGGRDSNRKINRKTEKVRKTQMIILKLCTNWVKKNPTETKTKTKN